MLLDIIICTYNRPQRLLALVNQLQHCSPKPNKIIVVDSSETENEKLKQEDIVYVTSSHKNQPYQRYLGYQKSQSDLLLYLDDDMEVIEPNFIDIVKKHFTENQNVVAMALHFQDKQTTSSLSSIPTSNILKPTSTIKKIIGWFTGYPTLATGKLGLCGIRGKQPSKGGFTEWLSGGAFVAKRVNLFQNFNFQLFDLFEHKLGMGEDAMIGYTISKQGKIYYEPSLLFYHNDLNDSNYSLNHFAYAQKVMYSRLYLSLEKTRLDNGSLIQARLHFIWYALWRLLGYFFNYAKNANPSRKEILLGSWSGFRKTLSFTFTFQAKNLLN